ncbi:U4/U6.U5 tri-snRNP-associated protein 1 isoform X1 [Periplaneta americana]|uniref:U4/U6.U5 tri-snRNP-associated protein 1 isoform X1 n=2 Tax=Periplaneta americana TaxID=6978 RepID=UPI0037E737CA
MGSTKKHKIRDSKKRKHRSRSKSRSPERSKHRHHKKHHKDRKKEKIKDKNGEFINKYDGYDSEDDVIAVPPPPKISRPSTPPPPAISSNDSPPAPASSRTDQSLSIEETNKLRARLGLKPLRIEDIPAFKEDGAEKKKDVEKDGGTDMGEFVHKPAENLSQKAQSEKVKQRLTEHREKRHIESKLSRVKPLAESDEDDEDAHAWVVRSRKMQEERVQAEKRAKALEELDAEFGVGDLVEDEMRNDRKEAYTSRDLKGLRVEHAVDHFSEGKTVILTLKDQGVLDEDGDVLVNVNMLDDERYNKNTEKKKLKPNLHGYDVYSEEDDLENKSSVLSKYDEEIEGEKKTSFALGEEISEAVRKRNLQAVREKLHGKTLVSLDLPAPQLASEYYTEEEISVKFKKPKKKVRKIRRKLKAEELEPEGDWSRDMGSRSKGSRHGGNADSSEMEVVKVKQEVDEDAMETEDTPLLEDLITNIKVEPDESELELQLALKKARKLKLQEAIADSKNSIEKVAKSILESSSEGNMEGGSIVLNATAEFCRTLGDIPTYGLAGNRDEDAQELLDFEREMIEEKKRQEEEGKRGAWNEVEIDETPVDVLPAEVPILDVEPDVGVGVAGALRLAVSKGYLEREDMNKPSASRFAHLQAQNYSIEDKTHIDDDKFGRRERYSGPTSDFKEKDGYKPNVKLDYIDDDGHVLNAKEAFRYLSHKFHGKGPGKNKVEKRMKKNEQEGLMKQMSSTDTPLGTLSLLQQKQKETQSPFVVLSGSKQTTTISKTKL